VGAGAHAVHIHPCDDDGRETLVGAIVDATVATIRVANPGVPIGVSTGAWILPHPTARVRAIADWREPDFAGVNLSEPGHRQVMAALSAAGIGIEAGIWTVEDVDALERCGYADRVLRVLVEPADDDPGARSRAPKRSMVPWTYSGSARRGSITATASPRGRSFAAPSNTATASASASRTRSSSPTASALRTTGRWSRPPQPSPAASPSEDTPMSTSRIRVRTIRTVLF
jgi:hypothetical protein